MLWLLSTVTVVVLLFGYHTSTAGALKASTSTATPVTGGSGSGSGDGSGSSSSGSSGSGNGSSGSGSSGSTKTTTVDGDTAQTQWGPVQVELVIENGSITNVAMLQYPNGNGRDIEINNYALPILIQQTVESQGQQVDMISGATVTSVGYLQSLQSALDQANL